MMEASELRIGNLVDFVNRTNPLTRPLDTPLVVMEVTQIVIKCYPFSQSLHKVLKYNSIWLADVEPIPITEEWLVGFGFKKICEIYEYNDLFRFNLKNCEIEIYLADNNRNRWMYWDNSIEYVHKLQNLYFALTGTELILNNL